MKMNKPEPKPLSIIDALASGYELILRHPAALLIPVVLDFFLWLGPQINAKPLFQTLMRLFVAATPSDAPAETLQNLELLKASLQAAGDSANLFGVLTTLTPTLIGMQPPSASVRTIWLTVSDGLTLLLTLAPLGVASLVIASVYFVLIARALKTDASTVVTQWFRALLNTGALAGLLLIVMLGVMFPLTLAATAMSLVSQGLGSFLLLGGMLLIFWTMLYLAFALPAIFISQANPVQAILNSISIFRFDFWSAMGLVFLIYLIRMGFTIVWQFFLDNPWGIVFVVIANAFLGSGLVAAGMVFYNDRMNWLAAVRERLRQQQTQTKG